MNKSAIKNFAIWARNELISEITYKAGLLGITETGIKSELPQSGNGVEYYDVGTKTPYAISGKEIQQRKDLVNAIQDLESESDYKTAYMTIIDETAYTWFNRLIAIRFMEVNDYLPSKIRVLSSINGKTEPDIVTEPFEADLEYTEKEKKQIINLKNDEKADELFRILFLKQCNALSDILPALFEKVSDYTELLLSISYTDKDGIVYRLVHDIPEEDFNVAVGGQVEIIGWLYQYYNTEPKAKVFGRASGTKIKKEEIPAATQLFTPDWIVRYMVENSLGRLWVEGHPENEGLKAEWKYYLEETEQEDSVKEQLAEIRKDYAKLQPEDLLCIDPCMGSGHILCYFFDVLMQIYEACGYAQRDAARSILENNIYGLDIDDRAYQLSYFAVMMKARQYDKRIFSQSIQPHVYAITESNSLNWNHLKYFGRQIDEIQRDNALNQIDGLIDALHDAKEYGSILSVDNYDWNLLREFTGDYTLSGQMNFEEVGIEKTQVLLQKLINVGETLAQKYNVVVTNPPYMAISNADAKVQEYVKKNYPDSKADLFAVFIERCSEMTKQSGYQAMITQHVWMFLSSYEELRTKMFNQNTINLIHLGPHAFEEIGGEVVQTASFVRCNCFIADYKTIYCRLIKPTTQQGKEDMFFAEENRYVAQQINFTEIPGSPVAYWVGKSFAMMFRRPTLKEVAFAGIGMRTGDNERFLRLWFEISRPKMYTNCISYQDAMNCKAKWIPYNKGGNFRRWYGNNEYVVNWENNGYEIKENTKRVYPQLGDNLGWKISNEKYYFREGITWTVVSTKYTSFRRYYSGAIFSNSGQAIISENGDLLDYLTGLLNTNIVIEVLNILSPTMGFESGYINKIPIIYDEDKAPDIISTTNDCIELSKNDWDSFETSWDFKENPLVRWSKGFWDITCTCADYGYFYPGQKPDFRSPLKLSWLLWQGECDQRFNNLKANEEELNRIFIDVYGLQEELTPEIEEKDVTVRKADMQRDIKSLISYAVGCMFGRYSLDQEGIVYAGGDEWPPRCLWSPMFAEYEGDKDFAIENNLNPNDWVKVRYPLDMDNIIPITDEEYFDDDIVGMFCEWLKVVYGEDTLEANLDFVAQALGNKGNNSRDIIRNYFLNDFFKDHCSTYSVTGSGKRPIYWLYSSGKQNGFKALIYMHRYDADTTGRIRVNYLHHMEKIYDNEIGRMDDTIENSQNSREVASATKRKEKLQKQLKECRDYDEEIAPLAISRIDIDLDDGVKVNYRKVQTDSKGKFHEILADSKSIMAKA